MYPYVLCWAFVGRMLGVCWSHDGSMLGLCWGMLNHVGPCWAYVEACWAMLGLCWAHVGPMLRHLGPCWAYVEVTLGHVGASWAMLGLCWAHLGPCWAQVWPISRPSQKRGKTHDSRAKMPPRPKLELNSSCNCLRIMRAHKNASAPSVRADLLACVTMTHHHSEIQYWRLLKYTLVWDFRTFLVWICCWTLLDLVSWCFWPDLWGGCIATVQALSGTGSLQCIAQFLKFMGVTKARFHAMRFLVSISCTSDQFLFVNKITHRRDSETLTSFESFNDAFNGF